MFQLVNYYLKKIDITRLHWREWKLFISLKTRPSQSQPIEGRERENNGSQKVRDQLRPKKKH